MSRTTTPSFQLPRLAVVAALGVWLTAASCWAAEADAEFFERRVRPILAANCWYCHGAQQQESGLRLDSREALLRGGSRGEIVVPGEATRGHFVRSIQGEGELAMPPEKPLRREEVAILLEWVRRGLPWPAPASSADAASSWREHWAFRPVRRPRLPDVQQTSWPRTAVDRFLLRELEQAGLAPAAEAGRSTLIRRASFALRGIPPTPEEVAAFVAAPEADAWERLVDQWLAAPQYGERWGRYWLDVARYADTKGYVFFEDKAYPWAFTYRDYVIQAWNEDLPFDQFVREQLAADLLPGGDDPQKLAALGFLTVGAHFMNNTHDIVDDRIDVVTRGLLGLTVTCARCHDHKSDPVTTTDYYGLYGVFRGCYEPTVPPAFPPRTPTAERTKFDEELRVREKQLVDFVTGKHTALVQDARLRAGDYLKAAYDLRDQPPTDDFMLLVDQGDLNPTMILRWQIYLDRCREQRDPVWTPWHALVRLPAADFPAAAEKSLAELAQTTSGAGANRLVLAALRSAPLGSMGEVAARYGKLLRNVEEDWRGVVQRAESQQQPRPTRLTDAAEEELRGVLYGSDSPPQVPLAMDWGFLSLFPDRPTQGEYQKLLKAVETWMATGAGAPPRAMALFDSDTPFEARVFVRGNPHRLGDPAPRRYLAAFGGAQRPFQQGSGRRELAAAVTAADNPLLARVIVNRIWAHHFGTGLVGTPSDFGIRGEAPSHPELLDWLASELPRRGWSLKWLHRELMCSAAYRQSGRSASSPRTSEQDPENRLLAGFPRRRLEFEPLRDAMLSVADSLNLQVGGPSVELLGDSVVPRRTLYGRLDRQDVPALLTTFDFPNPLTSSPQRNRTTVAPQALYALNNGFVLEIARRLIERPDVQTLPSAAARIERLFRICYGRSPEAEELAEFVSYLQECGGGDADRADASSWRRLAHAVLLANEFWFVD